MESRRDRDSAARQRHIMETCCDAKAERDLWSLVSSLTEAGLLKDISENFGHTINRIMDEVPEIDASTEEIINVAYNMSNRFKKGRVLQDWLEVAAYSEIEFSSPNKANWAETKEYLDASRETEISNLYPDAQLRLCGSSLKVLQLHGNDATDQESLLWAIWLCIRSGNLEMAQKLSGDNDAFWLACALLGESEVYYTRQADDDGMVAEESELRNSVVRRGNSNRILWVKSCWDYASMLQRNKENFCGTANMARKSTSRSKQQQPVQLAEIEVAIYSALSNNLSVLLNCPIIAKNSGDLTGDSWVNKTWAVIKASHEHDLLQIIHAHHNRRAQHSDLYSDSSKNILQTENEFIRRYQLSGWNCDVESCGILFEKLKSPNVDVLLNLLDTKSDSNNKYPSITLNAEDILLYLQCCIMAGTSKASDNIKEMSGFLSKHGVSFPGKSRVLRVYCHLALWLRYSFVDPDTNRSYLSDIVPESDFVSLVCAYVHHLITQKQRTLVAAYVACLPCAEDRIVEYLELLKNMQKHLEKNEDAMKSVIDRQSLDNEEASIIRGGSSYLPQGEMQEICRRMVSGTQRRLLEEVFEKRNDYGERILLSPATAIKKRSNNGAFDGKMELTRHDKRFIEALRWLLYSPDHYLEALRQSHRFLSEIVFEMGKKDPRDLVGKCDSRNSFDRMTSLSLLWKEAQRVGYFLSQVLTPEKSQEFELHIEESLCAKFEIEPVSVNSSEDLSMTPEYIHLKIETSLLALWRTVNGALLSLAKWNEQIVQYSVCYKSMLGDTHVNRSTLLRFVPKIRALAEDSCSAFNDVLLFKTGCSSKYDGCGIKLFWKELEKDRLDELEIYLHNLRGIYDDERRTNVTLDLSKMSQALQDLHQINWVDVSRSSELLENAKVYLSNLVSYSSEQNASLNFNGDVRHYTRKAIDVLDTLKNDQQVLSCICGIVVSCQIALINETARILSTLDLISDAAMWYLKGVYLATTIASENHALYEILEKPHLERILESISESSVYRLSLNQAAFL